MAAAILLLFGILFLCGLLSSCFISQRNKEVKKAAENKEVKKAVENKEVKKAAENKEVVELETVFSTFDKDGDGYISAEELGESLRRLGLSSTGAEMRSMMERVDANGDGLIDLSEFRELYESLLGGQRADGGREEGGGGDMDCLREAFDVFDGNGDGLITVEELGKVLRSMGLPQGASPEDCRDMIRKVDLDGDGMVNFHEFKKMMAIKDFKL